MSEGEVGVSPAATDEEAVAIAAAMHALWPRPVIVAEQQQARETAWRFSGRWWMKPTAARRERPFR
ncbi:MAG: hypothetical protein AB7L17_20850 [Ilumatobacteraceae bacterium]